MSQAILSCIVIAFALAGCESTLGRFGMNTRGELVESSRIEPGMSSPMPGIYGCSLGLITGTPDPEGAFAEIGLDMPIDQVEAILGPPADRKSGTTKRFALLEKDLRGSYVVETVYPGLGRLLFGFPNIKGSRCGGLRLIWIIYNRHEGKVVELPSAHLFPFKGNPPAGAELDVPPGMNRNGEVVDSGIVERGFGRPIRGPSNLPGRPVKNLLGEATGIPAVGSSFSKIQVGMRCRQIVGQLGAPADATRIIDPLTSAFDLVYLYPGQGRLVFRTLGAGEWQLNWIIYNKLEPPVPSPRDWTRGYPVCGPG